jgi:hypothetical protein
VAEEAGLLLVIQILKQVLPVVLMRVDHEIRRINRFGFLELSKEVLLSIVLFGYRSHSAKGFSRL